MFRGFLLFGGCLLPAMALADPAAAREAFIEQAVSAGLDRKFVTETLEGAIFQQGIIDAISKPAEAKPWPAYRPIFITEARVRGGRDYLRANASTLAEVEKQTGVPPAVVTAIVGVETNYGGNMGRWRVLDALTTLGFHYPPRASFFRGELLGYLRLASAEDVDLSTTVGSYAGAMGFGQFMPTSYLAYAVDFDGDGHRDLLGSTADALGSVGNYLKAHGWRADEPVALRVQPLAAAPDAYAKPDQLWADVKARAGALLVDEQELAADLDARLLRLAGTEGEDDWVVFHNFYVITRYNRSPLYAMAVHQLAQEIAAQP